MKTYEQIAGLNVDTHLATFVRDEVLPGLPIAEGEFWRGAAQIIRDLTPENSRLLAVREDLQRKIDAWHKAHRGAAFEARAYREFLQDIGYLVPEGEGFTLETTGCDDEIAKVAGPQLVVPVNKARYALNAANARWGSLYDALYGTDALPFENGVSARGDDPDRRKRVVALVTAFLDRDFPLVTGSHGDATAYQVEAGALRVRLKGGGKSGLRDPSLWRGHATGSGGVKKFLLRHHGLHVELVIDRSSPVGEEHPAGLADVRLEAALSTIMDCEDSVAAVDAADKIAVYRNWLGLMKGDLSCVVEKGGEEQQRRLHEDQAYQAPDGTLFQQPARSLMLVRNVGHLMRIDMVRDEQAEPVFEGLLDGLLTSLIALHDLRHTGPLRNSRTGSIYIVKPKMHGPQEVAFADHLFARLEDLLGLPRHTIKLGLMDEERRTTLNLTACISAARQRLFFINTGFLDRTGDEIHTSMEAGVMRRKGDMKNARWMRAYEDWNVETGLACGLPGRAQIGKGMWAVPDNMHDMMEQKIAHPLAGANTAWVPSPTAAVLHALHYHQVRVADRQARLARQDGQDGRKRTRLEDLLHIPVAEQPDWSAAQIREELDNNAQSILGYVVRWIEAGVGCSKVPDIHNTGLMEDRATLRISSQHMANWLHHGICSRDEVLDSLKRMARTVDRQNVADPAYHPMAADFDNSLAFRAACDLVFKGREQPSGYTEPILHAWRREVKKRGGS